MSLELERPRSVFYRLDAEDPQVLGFDEKAERHLGEFDLLYRSLCALLYNYVPMSGHPGGSVSSGRIVAALLFGTMEYDLGAPQREDADILSYAAGHKALGLYALWALRDEIARVGAPELLPDEVSDRLRLEDLLGFRRNPCCATPLFREYHARALDGHPTPATPFVRLATGASGVGVATSLGLAFGARDAFGELAPRVHILEGEGGLTAGRVAESLAAAATAGLDNAVLHLDWNQSSIDSDRVCREEGKRGDYVQWTPAELAYLHGWNVIQVADGSSVAQVAAAQKRALECAGGQPTAVIYRTTKGWNYGIEGRASHGAGHKLCSEGFYRSLEPLTRTAALRLPSCEHNAHRCEGDAGAEVLERCFHDALGLVREAVEQRPEMVAFLAGRLQRAARALDERGRRPRRDAPRVGTIYEIAEAGRECVPESLRLEPGGSATLRGQLGKVLGHYNQASGGALFAAAADLLGSTSISSVATEFPAGFWHASENPGARLLSIGGICEDAMSGILAGISSFRAHIGVGSSYGAFLAPLGHVSARLHAIGSQARRDAGLAAPQPLVLVCAHAGLKTGEDGPTHADPQALQLLQENFPPGAAITLTPWDPQEVWPLLAEALSRRPALIFPFVTRPSERVIDRESLGLAPAGSARTGVYRLRRASGKGDGSVVLQGSGVTYAFVEHALPRLLEQGLDLDVFYVASAELFDALPREEQMRILPPEHLERAMGITGFTLATMQRWLLSTAGREATLHPFRKGRFLGSGQAELVLEEAGLDGESQYEAVRAYISRG